MPEFPPSAPLSGIPVSAPMGAVEADFAPSAAEPKSHAVIEQQQLLRARLRDAPAALASLAGPDHLVTVANDLFRQLFGGRPLAGLALRTALPELADQPFFSLLDEAYRTGLTSYGHEAVAYVDPAGHRGPLYFTFMAQAMRDAADSVAGLLLFAYDVSAHVLAQVSAGAGTLPPAAAHELSLVNEELATTNEELATSNEELLATNEELATTVAQLSTANVQLQAANADIRAHAHELRLTHKALRQLNQTLETRVNERTQALAHAVAAAEATAQQLGHVQESLPGTSFTVDQSGQILYVSPQWYAYTGMGADVNVSDIWRQLIHPDDLATTAQEFGAALAEGRSWSYEFRLRGAAGQYRWFASQGVPEPVAEAEAAGRSRQWFGSNLDIDDLKQAQRQLEEKDQLLSSILSSLPASVVTFEGEDLCYGFFNEAYQHLVRGRAVLGRPAGEVFPEAEEQGFLTLLREVLRTGEPYQVQEMPVYARDPHTGQEQGEEQYLDLAYLPLRHGQQPPHAVLNFIVDATDRVLARRQAEAAQAQALAAAERLVVQREAFYQLFEQSPAYIAVLREPQHRFEYVNPAYQRLFPGRQLVSCPVAEAVPEAVAQGLLQQLDDVYRTGKTAVGQEVLLVVAQPDGQPPRHTYLDFTYQAMREAGVIVGISIFATDTTERVLARRQREAQQAQLHALFMDAPAPIAILDGPDLIYQLVNPAYQHIFSGRELLGFPLLEAMPELVGTDLLVQLDRVYQTGETYLAQDLPIHFAHRTGGPLEERYFTFAYQARRDERKAVDGAFVMGYEVTDQVQARRQLARTNAQLTATNQQLTRTNSDLDNFVYTASHDLRQPISNIEGLLTILREELAQEPAETTIDPLLGMMQSSVERFKRTIAQLTDVAKLQAAHDAQPIAEVGLATLVAEVCQDLRSEFQTTGAVLSVDVADCPTLAFAEKNLRSIVFNLLSNALKYRDPGRVPQLAVRCHLADACAVLEVQDNGLGLNAAQQNKLFGLFQRLHDHVEGSGVGLYMVKKIIENAGGRVEVASQPGIGSTFRLYFPSSR